MSRGQGWLERAIEALFDTERDNAFTLGELCERIYGIKENRPRPAQRNAVTRAARNVATRRPEIQVLQSQSHGRALVFFRHDEVMSYGMAQPKTIGRYRSNDPRSSLSNDEQALRRHLAEHQHLVEPGGSDRGGLAGRAREAQRGARLPPLGRRRRRPL